MLQFFKKYRHGLWMAGFCVIYLLIFGWLEQRPIGAYHRIHSFLDDVIPFCEYFIVPYLLWFPYIVLTVLYFIFFHKEKQDYCRLAKNLCMGMSLFLLISYLYPNGQDLRPVLPEGGSIFTELVRKLYLTDTPTNILPSIHVFNSLAVNTAIFRSEALKKHRTVRLFSLVLCVSIVLSTMFLKQHSVVDVLSGIVLWMVGCQLFYPETSPEAQHRTKTGRRIGKECC